MENKPPKFVRWAVLIGIVVLLNVFSFISISYFYPEPEYNDFCEQQPVVDIDLIKDEVQCSELGGSWNDYRNLKPGPEDLQGYCDLYKECSAAFDDARTTHAQVAFLILLGIGAIAIIAGMFLKGSSIVAAGLSYGGVVLLVAAGIRYLGDLDQLIQIIAVGAALILVLVIAYKKFKD